MAIYIEPSGILASGTEDFYVILHFSRACFYLLISFVVLDSREVLDCSANRVSAHLSSMYGRCDLL